MPGYRRNKPRVLRPGYLPGSQVENLNAVGTAHAHQRPQRMMGQPPAARRYLEARDVAAVDSPFELVGLADPFGRAKIGQSQSRDGFGPQLIEHVRREVELPRQGDGFFDGGQGLEALADLPAEAAAANLPAVGAEQLD